MKNLRLTATETSTPAQNCQRLRSPRSRSLSRGAVRAPRGALPVVLAASVLMLPNGAQAQTVPQDTATKERFDTANLLVPDSRAVVFDATGSPGWASQQRGTLGDWEYTLFEDGSGVVRHTPTPRDNGIHITCTTPEVCVLQQGAEITRIAKSPLAPLDVSPDATTGFGLARHLALGILHDQARTPPPQTDETPKARAPRPALALPARLRENVPGANAPEGPQQKTAPAAQTPASAKSAVRTTPATGRPPALVSFSTRNRAPVATPRIGKPRYPRDVSQPLRPVTPDAATAPSPCTHPNAASSGACAGPRPTPQAEWRTDTAPVAMPPAQATPSQEPESWVKRYRLACSASTSVSLSYKDRNGTEGHFGKPRASIGCSAQLTPRLSARVSLIGYAIQSHKSASDADFTYALTYKVSDKIRLSYSNYSAQFGGGDKGFVKSLTSGALRASYKLPTVKLPFDKLAKCSASIGLPNPADSSLHLSCGIAITDKLSLRGTAYAYFPGTQQAYDPDFAYSASYKLSDQWRVTYSNFGNNRFFWNPGNGSGKGLLDGALTISYQFKF